MFPNKIRNKRNVLVKNRHFYKISTSAKKLVFMYNTSNKLSGGDDKMRMRKGSRLLVAAMSAMLVLSPVATPLGLQGMVIQAQAEENLVPNNVNEWNGARFGEMSPDGTFNIKEVLDDYAYSVAQNITWEVGATYQVTINLDSTKARDICVGPDNHCKEHYLDYKIAINAEDNQTVTNTFTILDGASANMFIKLGANIQGTSYKMYDDNEVHTVKINSVTLVKIADGPGGGNQGGGGQGGGTTPEGTYGDDLDAPYDFAAERQIYNEENQQEGLDFDTENVVVNGNLATGTMEGWDIGGGAAPAVTGYKLRWKDIVAGDADDWSMSIKQNVGEKEGSYRLFMKAETNMARKILVGDVDGTKQVVALQEGINDIDVTFKSWTPGKPLWISVAGKVQGANGERLVEEADKNTKHTVNVWGVSMAFIPEKDVETDPDDGDMNYTPASVNITPDKTQVGVIFSAVEKATSYKLYRRETKDNQPTDTLITEIMAQADKTQYEYSIAGLTADTKYTFVLEACFPEEIKVPEGANQVIRTVTTESSGSTSGGGSGITMGYPYPSTADNDSSDNNQSDTVTIPANELNEIGMNAPTTVKAKTTNKKVTVTIPDSLKETLEKNGVTYKITYKSSNNKILRINSKTGKIRAKKAGKITAKVTITFSNNQKKVLKKVVKVK